MGTSSTNVENPVNQIANLLSGESDAPQKKEETLEAVEKPEETLESEELDESQPQEESLAEEETEESAESSEEDPDIDTLNNLAEKLEIDISDMYALNLNLSRGEKLPEGGAITLGELKTFYEKNADIDQARTDIQEREQDVQLRSEQVSELPKVSNELLQARAQVLAIQQAYDNTDWNGIRYSNPGEYGALQSDFRSRFEAAKQQEVVVNQEFEGHKKKNAAYQHDRLFEIMPELKDDAVRVQVANDVQKFASKFGITSKEVGDIDDHRIMRMMITASKTEAAKESVKDKKIGADTPLSNKPSARKPLQGRKEALKRLTEKAKSTGQVKDQVNAVHEILKG